MTTTVDNSCVWLPGPWEHRFVTANGTQFHLAHAGQFRADRPLVLLVHGYPEYWWAWRHQIEKIAQAGFEVAAVDMRGAGGSDKTTDLVDPKTLAQDLVSLGESLGASSLVIVAHGTSGAAAWGAARLAPHMVRAIMTVFAPHPRSRRGGLRGLRGLRGVRGVSAKHLGWLFAWRGGYPAPKSLQEPEKMREFLTSLSAPQAVDSQEGAAGQAALYTDAMLLPEAANVQAEQMAARLRIFATARGRAWMRALSEPISQPVWAVRGMRDPAQSEHDWSEDATYTNAGWRLVTIPGAGFFVPEEAPDDFTRVVLDFLSVVSRE